jgi:hypothetical protein
LTHLVSFSQEWEFVGLAEEEINVIAIDHSDSSVIYAGTTDGIQKSTDAGEMWTVANSSGPIFDIVVHPESSSVIYATRGNRYLPAILKSSNCGQTWVSATGDIQLLPEEVPAYLDIDPANGSTLYVSTVQLGVGRFFKTTNGGINWLEKNDSVFFRAPALEIAVHDSNPQIIYVAAVGGLYKSTNGGETWEEKGPANALGGYAFAIEPFQPSTLYYGMLDIQGFFKSMDGGNTWIVCNTGLTNRSLLAITVATVPTPQIFLGTSDGGVFRSTDRGGSWHPFSEGLPASGIYALTFDASSQMVYGGCYPAGINPGGIYKLELSIINAVKPKGRAVVQQLSVNVFPNPFNSSVNITYNLPTAGDVDVKMIDILGRKVWEVNFENQNAGVHTTKVDMKGLGLQMVSGIYFVQVSHKSGAGTRKVLYLK